MCCRYVLQQETLQALAELMGVPCPAGWNSRYNLAPGEHVPVIRAGTARPPLEMALLRWGLVPAWARQADPAAAPANARAESLAGRPSFRDAFRHQRCLLPASGFYEWQSRTRGRQPHLFRLRTGAPFCFAGLWEAWRDPVGGEMLETCVIITTAPNELMAPVHDRMPAIVAPAGYSRWLDPHLTAPDELMPWLRPFPAGEMIAAPVSRRVNDARNDDPLCLEAVAVMSEENSTQLQFDL